MNESGIPLRERVLGGVVGLVVGDALGLPVQFIRREDVDLQPVDGMRGGGAFGHLAGTWSDDSSMSLSIAASLLDGLRWVLELGELTPPPLTAENA